MNNREYHYSEHKKILEQCPFFDSLIMAAYRKAGPTHQKKLSEAFPYIIDDLLQMQLLELRGLPLDQCLVTEVREPGPQGEA